MFDRRGSGVIIDSDGDLNSACYGAVMFVKLIFRSAPIIDGNNKNTIGAVIFGEFRQSDGFSRRHCAGARQNRHTPSLCALLPSK